MIDLLNDLTLTFVWLIHNFENKTVDLKFRVLPTIGTVVATGLDDWLEFNITFVEGSAGYTAAIGKSKTEIWTLVVNEWTKYQVHKQWTIDVIETPELTEPEQAAPELTYLFEYINTKGVK